MFSNFELDDNLLKTIQAYLSYTCFLWFKPLYTSLNKKLNLTVEENTIDEEKLKMRTVEEMITLTRKFRQLFDNYSHVIMDHETIAFFEAKEEIERINQLLTTTTTTVTNVVGKFLICLYNFLYSDTFMCTRLI